MLQNIRETYINLLAKEMPRTLILSYVKKKGFKPPTERRQEYVFSNSHEISAILLIQANPCIPVSKLIYVHILPNESKHKAK